MDVFLNLKFLSLIQNTCIIISNQFPGIQCSDILYSIIYRDERVNEHMLWNIHKHTVRQHQASIIRD